MSHVHCDKPLAQTDRQTVREYSTRRTYPATQTLRALVLACALFAAVTAIGQKAQAGERLTCKFELGNAWSFQGDKYVSETPQPLSFDVADIDLEAQSAKLYTSAEKPPGPLRVVRAINANHFIEVANEGFLNLTTIYDSDPKTGASPAVHSRHFGFLGQPIFAQYAGTCRPK